MMTAGIAALPMVEQAAILAAVRAFTAFGPANDPYGEHDFGAVEVGAVRVCWKIDACNRDLRFGSPDPAATVRVLTIMLAGDY